MQKYIIKDSFEDLESIDCMAIINPQMCRNSSIQIEVEQANEGPIPHLYVYLDKTRNPKNCSYVRLDAAEYSPHHKDGKRLKGKQKSEFIKILSSIWKDEFIRSIITDEIREATGYERAVRTWIATFGETIPFNYDNDGFPIMPDYTRL